MKELEFYEKVKDWDFSQINCVTEYDPKWKYYEKIKELVNPSSLILDLGCGGGEKILSKMPEVGMVIGTDFSTEMIKTANQNLLSYPNKRVAFTVMNNFELTFPHELFDLVSARHTPTDPKQIYDILKVGGYLIIEGIDRDDCLELKETFGYGQAFNDKVSISQIDYQNVLNVGFKNVEFYEINKKEFFPTKKDLLALLYKAPIIIDFVELDNYEVIKPFIDEDILDKYIENHTYDKGILLNRKLYGIIAKK